MTVAARIVSVALVMVVALAQAVVGWRVHVAGVTPDVLILVVSAIALLTGSVSGAAHGFLAGVAYAVFVGLPVGPHAMIATIIGYAIGRVGDALITDDHPVPPLVAGMLATLVLQLGNPLVEFLVAPVHVWSSQLLTQSLLATLVAAVLAVPVFVVVRRVLQWSVATFPALARSQGGRA